MSRHLLRHHLAHALQATAQGKAMSHLPAGKAVGKHLCIYRTYFQTQTFRTLFTVAPVLKLSMVSFCVIRGCNPPR